MQKFSVDFTSNLLVGQSIIREYPESGWNVLERRMMETYYGMDDTGDLRELWDNDFGEVRFSLTGKQLGNSEDTILKFNVISDLYSSTSVSYNVAAFGRLVVI